MRLPQAENPATKRAAAKRSVTLRLLMAIRLSRLTCGSPPGVGGGSRAWSWGPLVAAARRSSARPKTSSERLDDVELVGLELVQQLAKLALVQLAEAFEEGDRVRRRADDDLAAVVRFLVPLEQSHLDQPVGQLARGRRADPEPGRQLGHPQPPGRHHDVQDLGLRHRDVDLGELGGVGGDQTMHQPLVAVEDGVDRGRRRPAVLCQRNVRRLRTIR